jgi:hypothetical protein
VSTAHQTSLNLPYEVHARDDSSALAPRTGRGRECGLSSGLCNVKVSASGGAGAGSGLSPLGEVRLYLDEHKATVAQILLIDNGLLADGAGPNCASTITKGNARKRVARRTVQRRG